MLHFGCLARQSCRLQTPAPVLQGCRRCCRLAAVRQASLLDVEPLAELAIACEAEWTEQQLELELLRDAGRVLLAHTVLGQLAGACIAWLLEGELQVLDLFVAPAHMRQGHARDLLSTMLTRFAHLLQSHTCSHHRDDSAPLGGSPHSVAYLEVGASNEAAMALYLQLGFKPLGRRRNYYGPGSDAVLMSRQAG